MVRTGDGQPGFRRGAPTLTWCCAGNEPSADAGTLPASARPDQSRRLPRYIHDSIDALVGELGIDYIKWDHNKFVTEAVSPRTGRPAVHGQTLAVYRMFRDLEVAHPGLEIESCASGGGHADLGILEFANRVWTSDCVGRSSE